MGKKQTFPELEALKNVVDSSEPFSGIDGVRLAIENAIEVLNKERKDKRVNYYNVRNLLKRALDLIPKDKE